MALRVTVNIGFITNSSSCVYHFPKEILEDPKVKAFMEAYDLDSGYVGSNLWNRGACSSFLVTAAQKEEARRQLSGEESEYGGNVAGVIDPSDDGVYIIYGDEYSDTTHIFCRLLSEVYSGKGPHDYYQAGYVTDFN